VTPSPAAKWGRRSRRRYNAEHRRQKKLGGRPLSEWERKMILGKDRGC